MSFNNFSAVVNIVTDVEVKVVGSQNLAKCRSVHKSSYKDNSDFFMGLNFWGNKAAAAEKILKKGSRIFVKGSLVTSSVGERTYFDLNVDDFFIVDRKERTAPEKEEKVGKETVAVAANVDEDLPF